MVSYFKAVHFFGYGEEGFAGLPHTAVLRPNTMTASIAEDPFLLSIS